MTTPHHVDRYLELVDPLLRVRDIRAEIVRVEHRTASAVTLTLRPTRRWSGFEAGQFVQVGVVIDGVRHTRCYSPANSATEPGVLELTVKAHVDGFVSRHLRDNAAVGQVLDLSAADGVFVLPRPRPREIVLLSGGSGITPMMSMVRTLVDENYDGNVTFVHYCAGSDDIPYRRELAELGARANVHIVYGYQGDTDQDGSAPGGTRVHGRFDGAHLDAVAPGHREAETYICGPHALTEAVRAYYRELGLEHRVHTEEFAAQAPAADPDADGQVCFARSGVRADNNGNTILEQAEAAGLSPEFGCRMGICFSCTATKKTGSTRNVRTGEIDAEPDRPVQLCISVPVGDVELDV
ncbi:ferredoxin reductase [Rhodococcus sp. HNM0569]|uniref:ferredoxin reductase n=1 Tax=Rhodococcus sp. HNM0569 TaxID=2716340 RepID=UPI001469A3D5|nr:ferredoxin reductase [Rhodococcus sp. HNM0569]NLU83986.1 ferredoxin reductase [Rhodococcus sp. HNM0569]